MSSFSSVEQALVELLTGAVPAGVKVTMLPPQQAASPRNKGRRINVALLRAGIDPTARNAVNPPSGRSEARVTPPLSLDLLVSVHLSDYATTGDRSSALLENALRAVLEQPVLALPSPENTMPKKPAQATVSVVDLSLAEWADLWTALQTPWQPAVLIRARLP